MHPEGRLSDRKIFPLASQWAKANMEERAKVEGRSKAGRQEPSEFVKLLGWRALPRGRFALQNAA